jgi:mono/diheme cytochrome c family protein
MTRLQGTLNAALVALALGGAVAVASCGKTGTSGDGAGSADSATAMTQEEKIELGRHLTVITGCTDCHTPGTFYGTPDMSRNLSGSELGWTGPWGTTYPSNLTPDMETGLGSWTEEQLVTAFRTGKRPDGSPVLPPMPWPNYAYLTDEEAYAIAAYLKSIPPVKHAKVATLPPGARPASATLVLPSPSAWDAPRAPADSGSAPSGS